jgi:hypothetical protein
MKPLVWAGLAASVFGPAAVWAAGQPAWAWGLWIGAGLGLAAFFWIRLIVRRAFRRDAAQPATKTLLWHSALRLGLVAGVLFLVIKTPAIQIWGAVLGYTLVQIPAMLWEARTFSRRARGVV